VFSFLKWGISPVEKKNPHLTILFKSIGITTNRPELYLQALRHKSLYESAYQNNERLEFLGDSILDSVVAEILFAKFPQGKEGFLTQIRSRIVSRTSLNKLGFALGLDKLIEAQMSRDVKETSLSGNAMEAIIGAIYIDKGFKFTNQFIRKKLIEPHIHFDTVLTHESDPKSRVIEIGQKQKVRVDFQTTLYQKEEPQSFQSKVMFDGQEISKALGLSKKKAEQKAAADALKKLQEK
jgi:ribonuclease-3